MISTDCLTIPDSGDTKTGQIADDIVGKEELICLSELLGLIFRYFFY